MFYPCLELFFFFGQWNKSLKRIHQKTDTLGERGNSHGLFITMRCIVVFRVDALEVTAPFFMTDSAQLVPDVPPLLVPFLQIPDSLGHWGLVQYLSGDGLQVSPFLAAVWWQFLHSHRLLYTLCPVPSHSSSSCASHSAAALAFLGCSCPLLPSLPEVLMLSTTRVRISPPILLSLFTS